MYSRRSGFIRRSNSNRLTRHGATQYLRDLNSTNVPPYMITQDKIPEAQRILQSTGNVAVIQREAPFAQFADRFLSLHTTLPTLPPLPSVNQYSQVNLQPASLEFDSNDASNRFIIPFDNIRTKFEVPELAFDENNWRNAIEISYKQEYVCHLGDEEYPWIRSIRWLIVPYNVIDFSTNSQNSFTVDITCDNDNNPSVLKIHNTGEVPVIVFNFLLEQNNPAELDNPSVNPFNVEFPLFFKTVEAVENDYEPRFITIYPAITQEFYLPSKFNHAPIEISTDPVNAGEVNIYMTMSSVQIEKVSEGYNLITYNEDEMTNHLSSPDPLQFTASGAATVLAPNTPTE